MYAKEEQTEGKDGEKYYVKGSGTSACLLTGRLDDQPQWIEFSLPGMSIIDLQFSGLFAVAIAQKQPQPINEEPQSNSKELLIWGNLNDQLVHQPKILGLQSKTAIQSISCGWNHALLLAQDGTLLGLGDNKYGQLGLHNEGKFLAEPVLVVEGVQRVTAVGAGFRQSYWVTKKNEVYGCGESKNNELGIINKKQLLPATKLQFHQPQTSPITKLSCGKRFVTLLTQTGQAYALGSNDHRCLSPTESTSFQKFTRIATGLKDIECGWTHVVMLERDGAVRTRGRNNFGQLGRKNGEGQEEVQIGEKCVSIKAGTEFSFAIGESGKLYGWGWNQHMNIINDASKVVIQAPTPIETPNQAHLHKCFTYPAITLIKACHKK